MLEMGVMRVRVRVPVRVRARQRVRARARVRVRPRSRQLCRRDSTTRQRDAAPPMPRAGGSARFARPPAPRCLARSSDGRRARHKGGASRAQRGGAGAANPRMSEGAKNGSTLRGVDTGAKPGSGRTLRGLNPPPNQDSKPPASAAPIEGEQNTLAGLGPSQGPKSQPNTLHTQEFQPDDFRDLPPELIEAAKQGKPLPKPAPAPLAGSHQRTEPIDPTPIEIPLQATEYAEARPLPPTTDHETIETETIKVDPEADPRRATTQKSLRTLARAKAAATEHDAPPTQSDAPATESDTTTDNEPTVVDGAPTHRARGWKFAVVGVLLLGGVVAVLATGWSKKSGEARTTEPESASTRVAPAALATPSPTARQTAPAKTTPAKSTALTPVATPAPTKMPAPTTTAQSPISPTAKSPPISPKPSAAPRPSTNPPAPKASDPFGRFF